MKKLGIKGKIILGFWVLTLQLAISAVISIYELVNMRNAMTVALSNNASSLAALHETLGELQGFNVAMRQEVVASDSARGGAAQRSLDSLSAKLLGHVDKLTANVQSSSGVICIIAMFAGIALILLFSYYIRHYFVNPLVRITRAVENTVEYKAPFRISVASDDEMGELCAAIAALAAQAKKAK
jgi:methyl-accepting chemotaxis protein